MAFDARVAADVDEDDVDEDDGDAALAPAGGVAVLVPDEGGAQLVAVSSIAGAVMRSQESRRVNRCVIRDEPSIDSIFVGTTTNTIRSS